jgi:hypothetical protein
VLVATEEKEPVLDNWTTNRETTFIAAGFGSLDSILVEEEIVRIEFFVLQVEVSRAIELISSAPRYELEVATARAAGRSIVKTRLQFNFR